MTLFRNILAVIIGLLAGSFVNKGLVTLGYKLFPPPPGLNPVDSASFAAHAHLLEPRHFVFPFLAHALGTLIGALIAYAMAGSVRPVMAFVVGVVFLTGGMIACFLIPAPAWFIALDLLVAYLPMAWLATRIGGLGKKS